MDSGRNEGRRGEREVWIVEGMRGETERDV